MFILTIPSVDDLWDEEKEEFVSRKGAKIKLEHSLVSVAKWEQHYHECFLDTKKLSIEQMLYYIKCMTLTQNVPDEAYLNISSKQIDQIYDYIENPMTASKLAKNDEEGASPNREKMTNEIIYSYMIALHIPFECQKWHLNRLITLIEICKRQNTPPKQINKQQLAAHHQAVNARYRAERARRGLK